MEQLIKYLKEIGLTEETYKKRQWEKEEEKSLSIQSFISGGKGYGFDIYYKLERKISLSFNFESLYYEVKLVEFENFEELSFDIETLEICCYKKIAEFLKGEISIHDLKEHLTI